MILTAIERKSTSPFVAADACARNVKQIGEGGRSIECMQPTDFLRAALVGVGVLVGTLLASIPMVAVYAYLINPGQPPAVYDAAAQRIAPWSSHIVGPLLFLWWNYRGALRVPRRNATAFAISGIAAYFVADMISVPLFGLTFSSVLTVTFFVSLSVKSAGALLGARLGAMRSRANAGVQVTPEQSNG